MRRSNGAVPCGAIARGVRSQQRALGIRVHIGWVVALESPKETERSLKGEGKPVRKFLSETWLPALLFALPVFLFEFLSPGVRYPAAGTWTVYVLVVTPPSPRPTTPPSPTLAMREAWSVR